LPWKNTLTKEGFCKQSCLRSEAKTR